LVCGGDITGNGGFVQPNASNAANAANATKRGMRGLRGMRGMREVWGEKNGLAVEAGVIDQIAI